MDTPISLKYSNANGVHRTSFLQKDGVPSTPISSRSMDIVVARDIDLTPVNLDLTDSIEKPRYWMQISREQDIYRNRLISKAAYLTCKMMYMNNQIYILGNTLPTDSSSSIQNVSALPESAVKLLNTLEAWFIQVVEPPPLLRPEDVIDPTNYAFKLKSWFERLEKKTCRLLCNECDPRIVPYICLGSDIQKQVQSNMYNILQTLEIYGTDRETLQKIFGDKYGVQFSYKRPALSDNVFRIDISDKDEVKRKMKKVLDEYMNKVSTPHLVPMDSVITVSDVSQNVQSSRSQSIDDLKPRVRTTRSKSQDNTSIYMGGSGSPDLIPSTPIKTPRSVRAKKTLSNTIYTPDWAQTPNSTFTPATPKVSTTRVSETKGFRRESLRGTYTVRK